MKFNYFYGRKAKKFSFIMFPKILFTDERFRTLSTDAKVLYALMLDKVSLSAKNGWVDEENRVFITYPIDMIEEDLGCADQKAKKTRKALVTFGLIEVVRFGQGKADRIYVKDFSTDLENEHPEPKKEETEAERFEREYEEASKQEEKRSHFKKGENHLSSEVKNTFLEELKSPPNNTKYNNTKRVRHDPIGSYQADDRSHPSDDAMRYDAALDTLKDQTEYDTLIAERPEDEDRLNEILDIMTDILCSSQKTIRIGREEKPIEVVKSRFRKVGYFEMQYILDSLANPTTQIRNIRQYALTTIYNAPSSINCHYMAMAGSA